MAGGEANGVAEETGERPGTDHDGDVAAPRGLNSAGRPRLAAVDMLRGLVIVLMVLDHVRDFFHLDAQRFDPTNPLQSTPILFATRWVTHLCATSFVFLAGASILFQKESGKSSAELRRFLLARGVWLILLEVTVVSFGFHFAEPMIFLQVIWAIGAGLLCMALLIELSPLPVFVLGCGILALSPWMIAATAGAQGVAGVVRTLLLSPGVVPGIPNFVAYPVLPWLSVMCIGYGVAPILSLPSEQRTRKVLIVAGILLALFVALRSFNLYGDPAPWRGYPEFSRTVMSFLALSKYPPSPDFVLATLGVSLLIFLALARLRGVAARPLLTFGRTPLFTYLLHVYIAHGLMLVIALATGFPASVATAYVLGNMPGRLGWGFSLPVVYGVWLLVLALLYPLSRWFERLRDRRSEWWLRYL